MSSSSILKGPGGSAQERARESSQERAQESSLERAQESSLESPQERAHREHLGKH